MRTVIIGLMVVLMGLFSTTSSIANDRGKLYSWGAGTGISTSANGNLALANNSMIGKNPELERIIVNGKTVLYVSPDVKKNLNKRKVAEQAEKIQNVSKKTGITAPFFIVSEITDEEIYKYTEGEFWVKDEDKVHRAIIRKFSDPLMKDGGKAILFLERDNGRYELYQHRADRVIYRSPYDNKTKVKDYSVIQKVIGGDILPLS